MPLNRRLLVVAACLAVGVLAQLGLGWHLRSAEASPYPGPPGHLDTFPREIPNRGDGTADSGSLLRGWRGTDYPGLPKLRKKLGYVVDDLLSRRYTPYGEGTGAAPALDLFVVYSSVGDDRKHHPEICIRDAAGSAEDLAARRRLYLDRAEERPIMRFRFRTGATQYTTVYYWHYTFDPLPRPGQSFLQLLHQRLSHPAPSVTVQVSLGGTGGPPVAEARDLEAVEQGFLVAVDRALCQDHLPATARIGCNRLPIALTHE